MPFLITAVALVLVLVLVVSRALLTVVDVYEYQRGLLYRQGRFLRLLAPGRYWLPRLMTTVVLVDIRQTILTVPGQEVLTADGITVKVSATVQYQVADPVLATHAVADYTNAMHLLIQLLLRDLITSFTLEELLAQRGTLSGRLTTEAAPRMATFGVTLVAAEFKDLNVAAEIRTILSQIVRARQEGLAALERARGETAALRSLANAARLMEQHPALLHLRTLQAVSESVGNTFVLGMPPQHTLAGKPLPPAEPEAE